MYSPHRHPKTNRAASYSGVEYPLHHRPNPFRSFGMLLAMSGAVWLAVTFGVWWVL